MTAARNLANLLNGTVTFTGEVIVPTPVNANDAATKSYVDNSSGSDIGVIDNLGLIFDGIESRFQPTYNGNPVTITNPLRLLLSVNGIIQTVDFPEYVWQSPLPRPGFQIDSDGYINFSEVPPAGSSFDARILLGPATNVSTKSYPFQPADILLGA